MLIRAAVLCAMRDSLYKAMPGCDVYDAARDARTFAGGVPVVAHPPCAQWGGLRAFAKGDEAERQLGPWCVGQVRRWGGVLEHPAYSTLWRHEAMPLPGAGADAWGGWTMPIEQRAFGHPAQKKTWLYIVGMRPAALPDFPLSFELPAGTIATSRGRRLIPEVPKSWRHRTPEPLARWLVSIAERCQLQQVAA